MGIEFPDYGHKFRTILADPPWHTTDAGASARPRSWKMIANSTPNRDEEEQLYPTMKYRELEAMPVESLAAPQAHLWMWSMNGTVEQAYRLIRAWGFNPMFPMTWCKTGEKGNPVFGMGVYVRMNTEQLIFATRGTPAIMPAVPWMGSFFFAPRSTHSRKPDKQYEIIEQVSDGPRIELFARRPREGWTSWGNELRV